MKNNTNKQKIIEDFGEKIGGAKKDLWKERGLVLDDLKDMNDAEKNKYIVKQNVYPKPDYKSLYESGVSRIQLYYVKGIYDSLPKANAENPEEYIKFVQEIRKVIDKIVKDKHDEFKTNLEKHSYCYDFMENNKMLIHEGTNFSHLNSKHAWYSMFINKTYKALGRSYSGLEYDLEGKTFLLSDYDIWNSKIMVLVEGEDLKHEEVLNNYIRFSLIYPKAISHYSGMVYNIPKNNPEKTYPIHNLKIGQAVIYSYNQPLEDIKTIYNSKKEAEMSLEKIREAKKKEFEEAKNATTSNTTNRKASFKPKMLQAYKRVGQECLYGSNVKSDYYLSDFGFRGGEFGNWLNQEDRQTALNAGYEAFTDLANALSIDNRQISLGGKLAIAFGARGRGNALAHYEPIKNVINLTKMRGAGTLAHEWGHALDAYISYSLGNNDGSLASEKENYKPMNELIDAMKYKTVIVKETDEKRKDTFELIYKATLKSSILRSIKRADCNLSEETIEELSTIAKNMLKNAFMNPDVEYYKEVENDGWSRTHMIPDISKFPEYEKAFNKIADDLKRETLIKEIFLKMEYAQGEGRHMMPHEEKIQTDYYKKSTEFDTLYSKCDKGYWASDCEMFARAFACYIEDKLSGRNIENNYLTFHARNGSPVPEGDEQETLFFKFEEFVNELKKDKILTEGNENYDLIKDRLNTYLSFAVKDCFSAI